MTDCGAHKGRSGSKYRVLYALGRVLFDTECDER